MMDQTSVCLRSAALYQDKRKHVVLTCDSGGVTRNVTFILVLLIGVALRTASAEDLDAPVGSVIIEPNKIDLDSNISFYTVSCHIESAGPGVNSSDLSLRLGNRVIESKIVNETAIVATVDLRGASPTNPEACGLKRYGCYWRSAGLDMQRAEVGRSPAAIDSSKVKCISEDQRNLRCELPTQRDCDLDTEYRLSVESTGHDGPLLCAPILDAEVMRFESRKFNCLYLDGHEQISVILSVRNSFGKRDTRLELNNFDVVRPESVGSIAVTNVSSTKVIVRWEKKESLGHLNRRFRYEFRLTSEYGDVETILTDSQNMIYDHQLSGLNPYTDYTLMVRVQLIPKELRSFNEEYWSDWSSTTFRTKPCPPYQAPIAIPGAYSFKEISGDLVMLDVYWQQVPRHHRNGPRFGYNITAVSSSGIRYFLTAITNEYATFPNMQLDHYSILLSSYNSEGPSLSLPSVLEVFPPQPHRQPNIRKVLKSDDLLEITWFPAAIQPPPLNYTLMYCNPTATAICRESIHFVTIAPSQRSFSVRSNLSLNFALAANYEDAPSPLTWSRCVVAPRDDPAESTPPRFYLTEVTERSFVVRIDGSCVERSFHDRYEVYVRSAKGESMVFNAEVEAYESAILVEGLAPDTQYLIELVAVDERGISQMTSAEVWTAVERGSPYFISLCMVCAMLVIGGLAAVTTRRLRRIVDINVDIPMGLAWKSRDKNADSEEAFKMTSPSDKPTRIEGNNLLATHSIPNEYV